MTPGQPHSVLRNRPQLWLRTVAAGLGVLLLVLSILSSSSAFHHAVHSGHCVPDGRCILQLFAGNLVVPTDPAPVLVAPPEPATAAPDYDGCQPARSVFGWTPPGRAPPLPSVSPTVC